MKKNPSVPHRSHSPLVIVNALALTVVTLVAASDAGCHDHDEPAARDARYAINQEAAASGAANPASLASAEAPHEHSCVACRIGCSKSAEIARNSASRPLDLASAAARPENDGSARRGAPRLQAARGPPPG